MKRNWITILPVAAALVLSPYMTPAQTLASDTPGVVELTHALDAKKLAPDATIQMRLTHAVKLKDGTVLPKGTWLDATVAQDDMQVAGKSKLALRFTNARTKDGKTVPIKATILAVATQSQPITNNPDASETLLPVPNNLNNQPNVVDALGVSPGLDLHSKASSQNSGVFVSSKDDIKLPLGTKMELALTSGM
jgi:hypothetical protein